MMYKKVYVDIEAIYDGDINPDQSQYDKDRFFKDFSNWRFCCCAEHNGKQVKYQGIIGMLILDFEIDEHTHLHKLIDKKFIQLIGPKITKESLMDELNGLNEIIGYHCRTKANHKGYIGYDFGVINAQLGVALDDLPGVKCTDLEILCHKAGMYGGLKSVEEEIPTLPQRRSGILDGQEVSLVLLDVAECDDNTKRRELWKKILLYNKEDVTNMVYIEQWLKNIRMTDK